TEVPIRMVVARRFTTTIFSAKTQRAAHLAREGIRMRRSLLFARRWVAPTTVTGLLLWGSTYATEPVPVANGRLEVVQAQAKDKEAEKPKSKQPEAPAQPVAPTQPTQPQQP